MAQAITADDVKDILEKFPTLTIPSAVTDTLLDTVIQRKTAVVLVTAGLSSLPTTGTLERDVIDNAVLEKVLIAIKRYLRPDDRELLDVLLDEEDLINSELSLPEDSSNITGFDLRVVGGSD